jgi:hypothetical protein
LGWQDAATALTENKYGAGIGAAFRSDSSRRMFLNVSSPVVFRLVAMAFTAFALLTNSHGQGLSWSGVSEGSVIQLATGTTTTNLSITASLAQTASSTNLLFVLERQGNVILSRTCAPPYAVTFTNLLAGKYFLAAMLDAASRPVLGDLSFDVKAAPTHPSNDDWSQAGTLSTLNVAVIGSNLYATREANEPTPGGGGAGKSIWWSWTASASGVFTATTAGSSFDTLLGVYTGANVTGLATIGVNDDIGPNTFSQVTFNATNGVTYYFLVDAATGSAGGQAKLRLLAGLPPTVAITAPPDGYLMLVASSAQPTNVNAVITATDPAGIGSVEYWFDGGTNVSRSGSLAPPYQLNLTNLFAGHYILTVTASNNVGLVSVANAGLSVISLEPVLVMERSFLGKFQMGLTGFKGPNYTLQTSTNLDVWCGVNTWTNFAGAVKFADTNIAQLPRRFFRAASAQ